MVLELTLVVLLNAAPYRWSRVLIPLYISASWNIELEPMHLFSDEGVQCLFLDKRPCLLLFPAGLGCSAAPDLYNLRSRAPRSNSESTPFDLPLLPQQFSFDTRICRLDSIISTNTYSCLLVLSQSCIAAGF
ncbi:hypothetical protein GQ54DRAFT_65093 [Martensiomyces pterosporus]|nr:hypothetical protein GQ54DRAFT_65093 [Martensiomyces pterosporus]